jgi:hypothetical protein
VSDQDRIGASATQRNPAKIQHRETPESQGGGTKVGLLNTKHQHRQQIPLRSTPGPIDAFPSLFQAKHLAVAYPSVERVGYHWRVIS